MYVDSKCKNKRKIKVIKNNLNLIFFEFMLIGGTLS